MTSRSQGSVLPLLLPLLLLLESCCSCSAVVAPVELENRRFITSINTYFHIVATCEALTNSQCTALQELLQASGESLSGITAAGGKGAGGGGRIQYHLLQRVLNTWKRSTADISTSGTHLWFVCHDGDRVHVAPLQPNNTQLLPQGAAPDSSAPDESPPQGQAGRSTQHAAPDSESRCSEGSCAAHADAPWYLQQDISTLQRRDLLLLAAADAVAHQGAACLSGQLQHAAASRSDASGHLQDPSPAEAALAEAIRSAEKDRLQRQQRLQTQVGGVRVMLQKVREVLQQVVSALAVLLVAFAVGRYWPQLSATYQPAASPHAAAAAAGHHGMLPELESSTRKGLGGTGPHDVPEKLSCIPLAAAGTTATAPTAPATPARLDPNQADAGHSESATTTPVPHRATSLAQQTTTYPAAACSPRQAVHPDSMRPLTTAPSVDQLQMDNAQLAELVSQLHAELGGSKAAAAAATAAVQQQQAATQEAMTCLQEQLVNLELRISTVEEFGTAFNAAVAAAAAATRQRHHHHQQDEFQEGGGAISRYVSCVDMPSGNGTSSSSSSRDVAPPQGEAQQALHTSASPSSEAGNAASPTGNTPAATASLSRAEPHRQQQKEQQPKHRSSPGSSSGIAAAAAAAAAASAAATAAAAAARGSAATEAALQHLCDLLLQQGIAAVGALEQLVEGAAGKGGPAVTTGSNSAHKPQPDTPTGAAAHLISMREAVVAIAVLAEQLRAGEPSADRSRPSPSSPAAAPSTSATQRDLQQHHRQQTSTPEPSPHAQPPVRGLAF